MKNNPHIKKIIILMILTILVTVGFGLYQNYAGGKLATRFSPCNENTDVITVKNFSLNEKTQDYSVTVNTPLPADPKLEAYIKNVVLTYVGNFKSGVATEGDLVSLGGTPADLSIDGVVEESTSFTNYKLLSYIYTGGAHGMPTTTTFVFPKNNSTTPIAFDDLFVSQDAFLELVQSTIVPKIIEDNRDVYSSDSTVYTSINLLDALTGGDSKSYFQNFILTDEGITFIFDAYAVAPYSAGQPEITLPWDKVSDIISKKVTTYRELCDK